MIKNYAAFYSYALALLCLLKGTAQAQTISDAPEQNCISGIPVCQYAYSQQNSYSGSGTINELTAANQGCLSTGEKNSVWYIINVVSPGLLRFTITPDDLGNDYDFALWDITGAGCSAIYNYSNNVANYYPPLRCNYSATPGLTGLSDSVTYTSSNSSFGPFDSSLIVTAGQTFAICVSNFSTSVNGYAIDFSASSASIFDTIPPRLISVAGACTNSDSLFVTMSQPFQCSSLDPDASDFYIMPGNINIAGAGSSQCGAGGTYSTNIILRLASPLPIGNYKLFVRNGNDNNTLLSNCGYAEPVKDSVAFGIYPVAVVIANSDSTTCINNPFQLHAQLASPAQAGVNYTYLWSPDLYISSDTAANPFVTPPADISYSVVVLQNGFAGCSVPATVHLNILQDIILQNHDTAICAGQSVHLTITGDPRYTYRWAPAYMLSDSTGTTTVATPAVTTTYTAIAGYPGCIDDTVQVTISVQPIPVITLDTILYKCTLDTVAINASVQPGSSTYQYTWHPGNTLTDSTILDPYFFADTNTLLHLYVTTPTGCNDTAAIRVLVNALPAVMLPDKQTIPAGSSITLSPQIAGAIASYLWAPAASVNCDTCREVIATPLDSTVYTLNVVTTAGCRDSGKTIVTVTCDNSQVFIPNTFTPNGDGLNDWFYVSGKGVAVINNISIYDRWGERVFFAQNIPANTPGQGWDGRYKGYRLSPDVFIYEINALCENGQPLTFKGNISLVR